MEETADIEMPSPKRARVEAPQLEIPIDQATLSDGFDDIYGTPRPEKEEDDERFQEQIPKPIDVTSVLSQNQPQLPGLGIVDHEHATAGHHEETKPQPLDQVVSMAAVSTSEEPGSQDTLLNQMDPRDDSVGIAVSLPAPTNGALNIENHAPSTITTEDEMKAEIAAKEPNSLKVEMQGAEAISDRTQWLPEVTVDSTAVMVEGENNGHVALGMSEPGAVQTTPSIANDEQGVSLPSKEIAESKANTVENATRGSEEESKYKQTALPSEHNLQQLAEASKTNAEAEFELDSSPLVSSSSDSSTDSSSSDDSDADDYEMLSPEEQARRLMAEDGGSDGENNGKGGRAAGPLRTQNEKPDEVVPKPNITVTETMKIEELGSVENIVENLVLIKAKTSGEYQVLESNSVLCLENRTPIGVIAETLGRVQQPYYSVRYTNASAIAEAGITKDTRIFYVEQHSTSVFTQPLKAYKGSDASNLHDEEVGDDELEFSDDEAEAEHKRRVKQQRQAKRTGREGPSDGFALGPNGRRPHSNGAVHSFDSKRPSKSADPALNYDDADTMNVDNDEPYTPLRRPSNLHEILGRPQATRDNPVNRGHTDRGGRGRGRGGSRGGGRGDRGEGGGGRRGQRFSKESGGGGNYESNGHPSQSQPANGFQHPQNLSQSNLMNGTPPTNPPYLQHNGFPTPPPPPQQSPAPPQSYPQQLNPYTHAQTPHYSPHHQQQQPQYQQFYPQQQHQQYPDQRSQFIPPLQTPYNYNNNNNNNYNNTAYSQQQQQQPYPNFTPLNPYPSSQNGSPAAGIPPGAHINPIFFRQQQQQQQGGYGSGTNGAPPPHAMDAWSRANGIDGGGGGGGGGRGGI